MLSRSARYVVPSRLGPICPRPTWSNIGTGLNNRVLRLGPVAASLLVYVRAKSQRHSPAERRELERMDLRAACSAFQLTGRGFGELPTEAQLPIPESRCRYASRH